MPRTRKSTRITTGPVFASLPEDIIQHTLSFLNVEDCTTLVQIKKWSKIVTSIFVTLVDKTLEKYGNNFGQQEEASYSYSEPSENYTRYETEDDEYDDYQPRDVHRTTETTTYTLKITKNEKRMFEDEFVQYAELMGAEEGYAEDYVVGLPGIIIEHQDIDDSGEERGELEEKRNLNIFDYTKVQNGDYSAYFEQKKLETETFLRILRIFDQLKAKVYSALNGTRYDGDVDYQVLFLLGDGTMYELHLGSRRQMRRYTMYNE